MTAVVPNVFATLPAVPKPSAALLDQNFAALVAAINAISVSTGISINAQVGTTYTVQAPDLGKALTFTNAAAIAVALPQAIGSFAPPFFFYATSLASSVGQVTITPATSTIDGVGTLVLSPGTSVLIVSDGTNYQVLRGQAIRPTAILTYQLASGSAGSALGASSWTLGTLNTKVTDPHGIIAAFAASQFTLIPGTFEIIAAVNFGSTSGSQNAGTRLRNTTGSTTLLVGVHSSVQGTASGPVSMLIGRFTVAAGQVLEIDMWTDSGSSSQGVALTSGEVEMYKSVMITQVF